MATYRQLVSLDPSNPEAFYNLGVALKQKEDFEEAKAAFRKAVELQPDLPEAHYTLGVILWQQRKLDDATTEFRAALRAQPDCERAHYILGAILRQKGDLQGALEDSGESPSGIREPRLPASPSLRKTKPRLLCASADCG